MSVRSARRDDVPAIVDLWVELVDHHRARDPFFTRSDKGDRLYGVFIKRALGSDDWRIVVAEHEGRVVGYAVGTLQSYPPVYRTTLHGYVQDLVVDRAARGRGVGTRLYQALTGWFRERGVDRVEVDVSFHNPEGQRFWRRQGFDPFMNKLAASL